MNTTAPRRAPNAGIRTTNTSTPGSLRTRLSVRSSFAGTHSGACLFTAIGFFGGAAHASATSITTGVTEVHDIRSEWRVAGISERGKLLFLRMERSSRLYLVIAAIVTVVAWQFYYGRLAMYPFTLLATYAHEMGHGLTALLVGGDFARLEMQPDGSGVAHWSGSVGRIARGLVSAGGLVGPSVAGAILLAVSRNHKRAKWILLGLGVVMLLTVVIWTRGLFAPIFVLATAAVVIGVARLFPDRGAPLLLQLIGVQLCIAVFRDVDYMFSESAGPGKLSDTAAMAEALFLPYWFWGTLTAAFSFVVLALGLWWATRGPKKSPVPASPRPDGA